MKVAAYGAFVSVLAIGLADLTKAPDMIQYGALSLLGWIVWYLLAKAFPAHVRSQKEEREAFLHFHTKEREDFLESQDNARRDFRESLQSMARSIDCMAVAMAKERD